MPTVSAENAPAVGSRRLRRGGWATPWFLALWLALIFGTSCTVIQPVEFFRLIERFTGAGRDFLERFEVFWGASWFVVVKGWHVTEFAILTLLCAGAARRLRGSLGLGGIFGAMAFCLAFAASDEWHQSFVPGRNGTIQDVLIDSCGVGAAGVFLLVRRGREKR